MVCGVYVCPRYAEASADSGELCFSGMKIVDLDRQPMESDNFLITSQQMILLNGESSPAWRMDCDGCEKIQKRTVQPGR